MRIMTTCTVLALVVSLVATAHAGRIFGDIKLDGKPAPAGLLVTVAPIPKADDKAKATPPPDSTTTDKVGSYKLVVKSEGKCTLTVHANKQSPSLEVFSYKDPTRYDLIVETKDGKLAVRRK
jgi:hypothetical protein